MISERKNAAFEYWLREYGSHLEELAGAKLNTSPATDQSIDQAVIETVDEKEC